jgi:hypothetical protein
VNFACLQVLITRLRPPSPRIALKQFFIFPSAMLHLFHLCLTLRWICFLRMQIIGSPGPRSSSTQIHRKLNPIQNNKGCPRRGVTRFALFCALAIFTCASTARATDIAGDLSGVLSLPSRPYAVVGNSFVAARDGNTHPLNSAPIPLTQISYQDLAFTDGRPYSHVMTTVRQDRVESYPSTSARDIPIAGNGWTGL